MERVPPYDLAMTFAVTLRPLRQDEGELLVTATLGTMNWCGQRFTRADVLAAPHLAHYTVLDPGRGDLGVVAQDDAGEVVGVGWALLLPEDDPGYGFIDAATPEASFWVVEGARGHGTGRRLVRGLTDAAARAGWERLSLSVEAGNDVAVALYRSEGFVAVPGRQADGVMVRPLRELPRKALHVRELSAEEPKDVEALADLLADDGGYSLRVNGRPPQAAGAVAVLTDHPAGTDPGQHHALGLEEDGRLDAVAVVMTDWPTVGTTHVALLQVRGAAQRRGIGRALHDELIARFPRTRTWRLNVVDSNAEALGFWETLGYRRRTGEARQWRNDAGEVHEAWVLTRDQDGVPAS